MTGDVLSGTGPDHLGVLQGWFGVHWWNSRAVALIFIVVFVMLPLVLYRRVGMCENDSSTYVNCVKHIRHCSAHCINLIVYIFIACLAPL